MVYEHVSRWLIERCGCDPDEVCMAAVLDDLNVLPHERVDLMLEMEELYGVQASSQDIREFETVDDIVGFIEDRM